MTDVEASRTAPAPLDDFDAVNRKGRRNALPDVLDETVTRTASKTLIETLNKLHSIGIL